MGLYPTVDRRRRQDLLAEIRRGRRVAGAHELTPAQRLERSLEIVHIAHLTQALRPASARRSDESNALWRAVKARLAEADACS